MDGNFLSRYESKLEEFEKSIKEDPINAAQHEMDMNTYMLSCVSYIREYTTKTDDKHTIDNIFESTEKKGVQKQHLYRRYLYNVEDQKGICIDKCTKKRAAKQFESILCATCQSANTFVDEVKSDLICTDCGTASVFEIDGNLSYKEEQEHEKVFVYSYKRENHFNEWLSQFQAQESTTIPEEVVGQLRAEFKKQKIKDLKEITHAKVRTLLKKLRYNKYYEHVPYITNKLNGVRPPSMSHRLEETLRNMFSEIQAPFDRNCPSERKNFLSYSYVLYKFCELLGEDEFLPCFPLLKSKEKLYQQDVIWRKICKELQWEFIPTT